MGILSSIPILSIGGGVLDITSSLVIMVLMLALWVLMLLILHPLHAFMFLLAALCEYAFIYWFECDILTYFFAFFSFYLLIYATYKFGLIRFIPSPKNEVQYLIKLAQLHQENQISDEEFKAAKKRLLKL